MGAADHSEAGEEDAGAATRAGEARGVDRSHNRDALSSEAMTELLRDLQDAVTSMDQRLVALESSRDGASEDTRRLAQGVADMGDALSRRVRALEHGRQEPAPILARSMAPAPLTPTHKPRQSWVAWIIGLGFVAIVALAALWLLRAESLDRATLSAPSKAASLAPAPAARAVDETPAAPPQTPPHDVTPTHRSTPARKSSALASPTSSSSTAATGYGRHGPGPPPETTALTPPPS